MSKAFPIEISSDSDPSQADSANSSFHYDAFPPFQCEPLGDKMMSKQFDLQDFFPPHYDQGFQDHFEIGDSFYQDPQVQYDIEGFFQEDFQDQGNTEDSFHEDYQDKGDTEDSPQEDYQDQGDIEDSEHEDSPIQYNIGDYYDEDFQDQGDIEDSKEQELDLSSSRRGEIAPICWAFEDHFAAIPQKERVFDSGNGVNSKRSFEALYMNQQEPEKRVNKVFIPHQICNNIAAKKSLQAGALEESSHWSEDSVDDYITDEREFNLYPKNLLIEEGQDEASSLSSNPLRVVLIVKYKIRLAQEQEGSLANMKQKSEMVSKKHDLFIL